jgi:hypothetical protein
MNSEKKLYEELLLEHPELKESKVDIKEVISLMKQMNPDIVPDQNYKNELKQRLDAIAKYNPQKSWGILWFLKFFLPVFSFGFAVFWFVYFSDEFQSKTNVETWLIESIQSDTESIAPAAMMMLSDMADEDMLESEPESSKMQSKSIATMKTRWAIVENNITNDQVNISTDSIDNISDEVLEDVMPMMFSMDSMMEDSTMNENIPESEAVESMWIMSMESESIIIIEDIFFDICWEYNGLIKVLEDWNRTCILEDKNCYESDYQEKKCFEIINVTN